MMNVGGVEAYIRLRDDFSTVLNRVGASVDRFNKQAKPMAANISQLGAVIGSIALGRFVNELTEAQKTMDRMKGTLTVAAGGLQRMGKEMEFVRGVSDKFGLSLAASGQSYAQFAVAAKGTILEGAGAQQVFTSLSEAVTAMGLSSEVSEGAMRALTQMMSKGCHGRGSLIKMYDGTNKKVEDIVVGDVLIGPGLTPRTVLMLARGREEMFRVTVSTGESFVVNLNHKMQLFNEDGHICTVLMSDYLESSDKDKAAWRWVRLYGDSPRFTVESIGVDDFFGFLISDDHLYYDAEWFEHHNTVMAEELRGQLGERIPGAFTMAARSMGVTEKQLNKMLEQGQVLAVDLLPKLAKEWSNTFGPQAEKMSHSLNAEINRLKTALLDMFDGMSRALDLAGIARKLKELFVQINESGQAQRMMKNLGDAIKEFLDYAIENLPKILDDFEQFMAIIKTLVEIQLARWILGVASSLTTLGKAGGPLALVASGLLYLANLAGAEGDKYTRQIEGMVDANNDLATSMQLAREMQISLLTTGSAVINEAQLDTMADLIVDTRAQIEELERLREEAQRAIPTETTIPSGGSDPFGSAFGAALANEGQVEAALKKLEEYDAQISNLERNFEVYTTTLKRAEVQQDKVNKKMNPKEPDKANAALVRLTKNIEINRKVLALFQRVLEDTNGDFDKAKVAADAYKEVLKAVGVDASPKVIQSLMQQTMALKQTEQKLDDAADAAKELAKAQEDAAEAAAEANREFGEAVLELRAAAQEKNRQMEQSARLSVEAAANEIRLAKAALKSADAYRELSKELAIEAEILSRIGTMEDAINDGINEEDWQAQADAIREATGAAIDYIQEQERIAEYADAWSDAMLTIDNVIEGMGSGLAKMVDGFAKIKAAAGATQATLEGWAVAIEGMTGVLDAMGAFQTGNGGGFGGSSEGNYAAEGQMIGAIIGGIIGGMAGMPQVGMAIGGAAGGALGGFIKKGADEALAKIEWNSLTESFEYSLRKAEGGLGSSMDSLGSSIIESLQRVLDSIGAEIESMPDVGMKIRDGVIRVVVGGVRGVFKEMEDAISFTIAEMLKQGEISGIDDMLKAALQGTNADSLEGLASDLDAVMQVLSFGLTDSQNAIGAFTGELDAMRSLMKRLIGDSAQLTKALSNISIEEGKRWLSLRDQITGHQRSQAEIRAMKEQDALMFNAEKALRLAELQIQREVLAAKTELAKADAGLRRHELDVGAAYLDGQLAQSQIQSTILGGNAQLWQAEIDIRSQYNSLQRDLLLQDLNVRQAYVGVSYELLQAQLDALDALIDVISNIPDIDLREIRLPGIPSGGGSVGDGSAGDEGPVTGGRGHGEGAPTPELHEISDLLDQLDAIFLSLMPQWQGQLAALNQQMLEQIEAAHGDADALALINEAYEAQVEALERDALASLGLETVNIVQHFEDLADTLEFLQQQGAITEAQMRELGDSMFITLAEGLMQYAENEEVRMMLEDLKFRMQMYQYELQFEALKALNLLTKEQIMVITDLMDGIWDAYNAGELDFQMPDLPTYDPPDVEDDPTDELLERLLASIQDLARILENYEAFLTSLERGPLSGATLRQQFQSAQADFMAMLAAAQGGDMEAIRNLPGMAQEFLNLAGQYLDPSSAAYQQILAMVRGNLGGISDSIRDIVDAAPSSALGEDGVLDTIAQILAAMASRWGVNPGWNPGDVVPFTGGIVADIAMQQTDLEASSVMGGQGGPNGMLLGNQGGPNGMLTVHSPQLDALRNEVVSMKDELRMEIAATRRVNIEQLDEVKYNTMRRGTDSKLSTDKVA